MRREKSLKDKIYSWFRNRSNKPATVKQVQEAFFDYAPSEVEKALSKRSPNGGFDFCIYDIDDEGTRRYCLYASDFFYPEEAEAPKKEEKPEARTKKLTIKERIENWFKERGNKPATLKEVQKAFPDINPKSISGALSGKDKRGQFNFNADYPKDPTSPTRYYSFLPIEEAVEEAVRLATCEGDCSHCEAETCAKEEEQEEQEAGSNFPEKMPATEFFSPSEAESQQAAKKRIFAWFRENGNEPATLEKIQSIFSNYSPEVVRNVLNGYCKCFFRYPSTVGEYCLLQEDFLHPEVETSGEAAASVAASLKSIAKTMAHEDMLAAKFFSGSEAGISSVATSLKSIAKSLAQIAEVETAIAKLFFEKQKS